MSEIKVNKISQRSGTAITLGNSGTDFQLPSGADIIAQSGSTITIAAGATITNSGTATGFGATGAVNWDTTPKTTTVTAVSGVGYFVNTTSGAITVNLPAGVAGSIVAISDYANTAATNNIIIDPNGSDKINGLNQNAEITTNGAAVTLIYVDGTRGWKDVNDATLDVSGINPFVTATGGTILTCGDFKTHIFTGPGSFVVSSAGSPLGSNTVEYLTVAGGGSGAYSDVGGGGGAGGFRQNYPSPAFAGLPVSVTTYPITVGGGGASIPGPAEANGNPGTNSIFSTITSTGGGGGGGVVCTTAPSGGSGGGGRNGEAAGSGNTPPTSPPQGNNGGLGVNIPPAYGAGGGGGAGAVGSAGTSGNGGAGGIGSPIATTLFGPTSPSYGTPGPAPGRYFSGGGGGARNDSGVGGAGSSGGGGAGNGPDANATPGTINTGGGGGGMANGTSTTAGSGGSGIVVIRYKFQ